MLLKAQSDGSGQPGQCPLGRPDTGRMAAGKAHVQFRLNRRPKSPPLASKLTDNDDFLGGKSRDEHAHPSAECMDQDRKSTRLNSSHSQISYAVFCLKKKN